MKQVLIIAGLLIVAATAHSQDKKGQRKPAQPEVYSVKFTEVGLNALNAKIDSAINIVANSCIPSKDGNRVTYTLFNIRALFNGEYQRAKQDSTKK